MTELMKSAAAMATKVRVNCDCDDIFFLPFFPAEYCGTMPNPIQGSCQSRKSAKKLLENAKVGICASQDLAHFTTPPAKIRNGTFARPGASSGGVQDERMLRMLGKLAGAWLGSKIAGRHSGAKGAALGLGAAALARRGLGPLAVGAAAFWGARKFMERRRARAAAYPSEATPSSPGDEVS